MVTIITIANRKGGVAKTTTAVTLAHGLAIKDQRVLVVDLDPQGHVAPSLGQKRDQGMFDLLMEHKSLGDVVRKARKNLWIVPGNQRTATAENALVYEQRKVDALQKPLSNGALGNLDYLIFDTPPGRVGTLQQFALWMSDLVLIPSSCDYLSERGIMDVVEEMEELHTENGWRGNLLGILPTFFDGVTNESKIRLSILQEAFADLVLPAIHRATVLRECSGNGKTVFDLPNATRTAREYAHLVWRVLDE